MIDVCRGYPDLCENVLHNRLTVILDKGDEQQVYELSLHLCISVTDRVHHIFARRSDFRSVHLCK